MRAGYYTALLATAAGAMAVAAGCSSTTNGSATRGDSELSETPMKMEQLPPSVADAMRKALNGQEAQEIEQINYEGVAVLYEAEYTLEGREVEIVIRPDGQVVPAGEMQAGDDDADGDDDDAGGADDDAGDQDAVTERKVDLSSVPAAVADAIRTSLGDAITEVEEVRYEGIVILYEAESDKGEIAFFPNGTVAQPLQQDTEDDDDEAGEDDEDDRP